ncbi:MAG: LysR family transcriptional regulator [Pseudomonadales bacterium]|nr:LysR family transcriptional regulator [Pseudomonadales bacterium]
MKIFVRIIQLGSFTAVAADMGMTQSAISKKIAALESSLGATLLTRSNRQVLLTEVGTNYYEHCVAILNALDEAEAQTKDYQLTPKGNLKINVPVAFGRLHISPYLPQFMQTYPDIRLELTSLDRKVDVIGEGFDLVIRIGHLADSSLVARKLGQSPRVMVASPAYLASHEKLSNLDELKQHNCLIYSNLATVNIWHFRHQGKEKSVQVKGTMQSNSSDAIRECVLAGLGIAVLPNWLIQADLDAGSLVTIMPDHVATEFPINAVYPQNPYIPLKVRCFVNFMKDVYSHNPVMNTDMS